MAFTFDPYPYNGGYTNAQLQQREKIRGLEGRAMLGLDQPAQEAQPRPEYAPKRLNTVQSVKAAQAPQAPDYTKYEQEAQAKNQIFDGGGQRIPEYVSGAPRSLPAEVLGRENGNTTNFHTQWPDYNRKMAASGGDQGIFMQVGDGPSEFIPLTKNPRYTQARQQQLDDQIAMAQAKIPPQREFNDVDAAVKLAQGAARRLDGRYDYDSPEYKALEKIANDYERLAISMMNGGRAVPVQPNPQPGVPEYLKQGGAQPNPQAIQGKPMGMFDAAKQAFNKALGGGGGIQMHGQGAGADPVVENAQKQEQNDGEVIVTDPTAGETVIKRADGSFVAVLADGQTVPMSPEQVRQAIAKSQSQGQAR